MQKRTSRTSGIRLAELVAALSIATDLAMGQPMEYVLGSCVLSVRLGETLGLSVSELREVYYLALLRYLGCNAGTHEQAALVGDELHHMVHRALAGCLHDDGAHLVPAEEGAILFLLGRGDIRGGDEREGQQRS